MPRSVAALPQGQNAFQAFLKTGAPAWKELSEDAPCQSQAGIGFPFAEEKKIYRDMARVASELRTAAWTLQTRSKPQIVVLGQDISVWGVSDNSFLDMASLPS